MKIKLKLFFAFLSIGMLSVSLGGISFIATEQMNDEYAFLIEHDLVVLQNAQKLEKLVVDAETGQRGFIITNDESFLEPYVTGIQEFTELMQIEKQLVSDDLSQVEKLVGIEKLFQKWKVEVAIPEIEATRNVELHDESHNVATLLQAKTGKNILDDIRSEFKEFILIENELNNKRYKQTLELESYVGVFIVIAPIIIVTASLIMGFLLFRSISIPISKLKDSSDGIASGKFIHLNVKGNDEISQLTESFNMMSKSIETSKTNTEKNYMIIKNQKNKLTEMKDALDEAALVSTTDVSGKILYVNDSFCRISKYSREELLGENHRILKSVYHSAKFFENIWKIISSGKIWRGNIKNKAKDGTFYWVKTIIMPIFDSHNKIKQYVAIRIDITSEKKLYDELNNTHIELAKNNKIIKQQSHELIQKLILENKLSASTAELQSEKKFTIQKEEFAAMVSHELKTPIFPIKMHCEMLKDPEMMGKLNTEQLESVNMIDKMASNLERLTGDIFDAQKLDMKQMQFNMKKFKLCKFLDDVKLEVAQLVQQKNISLTFNFDEVQIISDRERLGQVLSNLIRNSIDFVNENTGTIDIGAMKKHDKIIFYVKDNGIGIPLEKIPKLFRKFYHIDTTLKRKHGGTGLGLVICKGIVEGLGGEIWVYSEVGKGTIFTFKIPQQIIPEIHNDISNV
ncbi:MAG: hypothetical protein COA77_06770 [Thaumarchaeota archaeon]|nr:MAG: hypothetical protein COA77_06770 [Nitrososphaerota archaeon]